MMMLLRMVLVNLRKKDLFYSVLGKIKTKINEDKIVRIYLILNFFYVFAVVSLIQY